MTGRSKAKHRRSPLTEYCRAGNVTLRPVLVRRSQIPNAIYDLVHSYCTQLLIAGGGDISLVSKARGHRDIRTTMIYTQVTLDPRLAAAIRLAFPAAT